MSDRIGPPRFRDNIRTALHQRLIDTGRMKT